jgi:preprotein translocase subunit SecG
MSGPQRFEREPKAMALNRRTILLLVAFVALGIVISLAFAHYGWAPAE